MKLNKIYSAMLAMLGFSACDPFNSPDNGGEVVMYGPLHPSEFRVHGVATADSRPVESIRILVQETVKEAPHTVAGVLTGVDGKYVANWTEIAFQSLTLTLLVEDIDGEQNGGEFATQTRTLKLTDADTWTYIEGVITAEVNLELVKKAVESENESK